MKKIIVAGSRTFNDYQIVREHLDDYFANEQLCFNDIEIVCGNCRGADKLGEKYAKEHGIKIRYFIPNWGKHGKAAGPIRNSEMAEYSKDNGFLFLFWDGASSGSRSMLTEATKRRIPYKIIYINKERNDV